MLAKGKEQEEMEATAVKVTAIKDSLQKEEQMRQQLETESKKLAEKNDAMLKELQSNKNRSEEVAQRMNALTSAKVIINMVGKANAAGELKSSYRALAKTLTLARQALVSHSK
uniref:Endosome-associated-trafficking regulator 1 n=1 Tax=Ditylenchus dipsaci TaxID=166011 RepID=A0A915EPR9_9BILA